MSLQLLQHTATLSIFYDDSNDWLYLDWQGELTRSAVQRALLLVLHVYLTRTYPRVLISNAQITCVAWDVPAWLAHTLREGLALVGVEQLAWVHAPVVRGRSLAESVANRLHHPNLSLFADVEQAVTWLGQTRPLASVGRSQPLRSAAAPARLH